jgi:hypothetical protein
MGKRNPSQWSRLAVKKSPSLSHRNAPAEWPLMNLGLRHRRAGRRCTVAKRGPGGPHASIEFGHLWFNADPVIHGAAKALLASQVPLCCLH